MTNRVLPFVCVCGCGMLVLAVVPLPYWYYNLLRPTITVAALFIAWHCYKRKLVWALLALALVAILYNPVLPIHLTKSVWIPINFSSAVLFAVLGTVLRPSSAVKQGSQAVDGKDLAPKPPISVNSWTPHFAKLPRSAPSDRPYPGSLKHLTVDGIWVRSKSEVIIANRLSAAGVPYAYELSLTFAASKKLPDFTIRDNNTKTTYYWEHSGMLQDPKAQQAFSQKMAWYEAHGIRSHKVGGGPEGTLILTYDTPNGGVSTQQIDDLIHSVILAPYT